MSTKATGQTVWYENGGSTMYVLARKEHESVVVGDPSVIERLLKVTVLRIQGGCVRLGFEVSDDFQVHGWEAWERIRTGGRGATKDDRAESV
jgi:sRNA-binding carbon storage regulator CsrA